MTDTMYTVEEARALLTASGLFFGADDDDPPELAQTFNLNDTWAWACADGEYVPDAALPEVATLFFRYGYGGILLWVSKLNGGTRSEFADVNRWIDYAKQEEAFRESGPPSSKRAYTKHTYTLGE